MERLNVTEPESTPAKTDATNDHDNADDATQIRKDEDACKKTGQDDKTEEVCAQNNEEHTESPAKTDTTSAGEQVKNSNFEAKH